jgi:hypothetical protein
VGYPENGTKLTLNAALITWNHWELVEVDEPVKHYQLDDPQPIEYDKMHIPTTYIAVVKSRNGKLCQLTAHKVESHLVCTCHCFMDAGTFNLLNHSDFSQSPG